MELAALVAVPPALAYALGALALWVQLSTAYDSSDAWTNWQAATLATKPFVAALGFGVLLRALTFSLLAGATLLTVRWAFVRYRREEEPLPGSVFVPLAFFTLGGFLAVLGGLPNDTVPAVPNLRTIGVPVALYLLFLCWPLLSGPQQRSFVVRVVAFYPRVLYVLAALAAVAFLVFFALFPGELRLPCLTRQLAEGDVVDGEVLTAPRAEELGFEQTEGRLVAHADGHWWVFDEEGRFAAIPDGDAARLVVEPFGELPSREESNYSGLYRDAPYNPIRQCR